MREEQRDAFQAQDRQTDTSLYEWCFDTSKGYRTIRLKQTEVESLSAPGQNADEACKAARKLPYIREQLDYLTAQDYQDMLGGEGADWHPLTDPVEDNESRVLWLAACNLREEWHENNLGAHQVIPPPPESQRATPAVSTPAVSTPAVSTPAVSASFAMSLDRHNIGFEDWRYVGPYAHGVLRFGVYRGLVAMQVYEGTVPEALQLLQHHFYHKVQISPDSRRAVMLMQDSKGTVVRRARMHFVWPDIASIGVFTAELESAYPENMELPGRYALQTYFLRTEIVPLDPVTYKCEE